MPYIKQENRNKFDNEVNALIAKVHCVPDSDMAGTLNYIITRLVEASMRGEMKYAKLNAIVGALECSKLEMYRRLAVPYEDEKIRESGDVKETESLLSTLVKDIPF